MRRPVLDRGAAAVEFALVLFPLTLLTFGIIYFGYAFHLQTMLDNAARDAVRSYTLSEPGDALAAANATAEEALTPAFGPSAWDDGDVTFGLPAPAAGGCVAGEIVKVTLDYNKDLPLTGLFGWNLQLTGSGSMQCNG